VSGVIGEFADGGSDFRVVSAMDKFRGTATARHLSESISRVALSLGCSTDLQPMSDGGEGFRDAFDGKVWVETVPGPLGESVAAHITMASTFGQRTGVIEVAEIVGRDFLASPTRQQALDASSEGVGHLILAAVRHGAESILIGCGGSATSDGGWGCYRVLRDAGGLEVPVVAATDVTTRFGAARRYATQKGVHDEDLAVVDARLAALRELYSREQSVDVGEMDRAGASGGIPGALAAFGASLVSGFDAVSQSVNLPGRIRGSSLVVTGEGRFDEGSLEGKVTVGIAALGGPLVPALIVCGSVDAEAADRFSALFPHAKIVSLESRFGRNASMSDVTSCVEIVVRQEIVHRRR
jgi:glycerate kinase